MKVTILGSGTSVPDADRRPPAFLIQAGGGAWLVDCGAGCSTTLAGLGIGLDGLDGVFLTHHHPDHVGEIVPMLFALKNPLGPRRSRPLHFWGPAGTVMLFEKLELAFGDWVVPPDFPVVVRDMPSGVATDVCSVLRCTPFLVQHSGPSFAYRFESQGRVAAFSGDTGPCAGLVQAAREADVFFCECATTHSLETHMSPSAVGQAAVSARVRHVVLTHLYAHIVAGSPARVVGEAFDGLVTTGSDGWVWDGP